jgi:WD40 repeat protein
MQQISILVTLNHNKLQLWKIRQTGVSKVPAAEFTDSETEIRCVDLDPSGNIAVSGSDDGMREFYLLAICKLSVLVGSIAFSDLRSQTHIQTMQPHADGITRVKFTPDGGRVITCSEDQRIKVFNVTATTAKSESDFFGNVGGFTCRRLKKILMCIGTKPRFFRPFCCTNPNPPVLRFGRFFGTQHTTLWQ